MRGSIQKRGKGSWRLVFDLDRDQRGKRRQKTVTFRGNKKDAEAELSRLVAEFENGGFVEPTKLTLSEFLEYWLESHAAPSVSAKTLERYEDICRHHLIPALGSRLLQKLSSTEVQAYYTEARKSGRRLGEGGLADRTVLHHHRILRSALKQALTHRLISFNPTDAVKAPRPENKEIAAIDEAQTAVLLAAARETTIYIPILLAVTTGLRRGEVLALRWKDINLDSGILTVNQTLEQTRGGVRAKAPKTKSSRRSVTIPDVAMGDLREHRRTVAERCLRLGMGWDDEALICARYDGQPRSPHAFSRAFDKLVAVTDIPRITFHGLRHSHATQMLRIGVHPKVAQERLGHSTIATTLDLYSHVTKSMQQDAAEQIDATLRDAFRRHSENKN